MRRMIPLTCFIATTLATARQRSASTGSSASRPCTTVSGADQAGQLARAQQVLSEVGPQPASRCASRNVSMMSRPPGATSWRIRGMLARSR